MADWSQFLQGIGGLHFVRPWILLALLVLPLAYWLLRFARTQRGAWARLVDPGLQRYVLTTSLEQRGHKLSALWYLLAALLILALAGPTWERLPQPVFSQQRPVVIALDLSQSMHAQDLIPSRLQVAKIKLQDLLRKRRDGQTALIAFAGDAFLVTPLTDDTRTIVSMLPSLTPRIMPVQGSRLAPALTLAGNLLDQAGGEAGEVIFITDGISDDEDAETAARQLARKGHRVSVISVGTSQGGLIKDVRGEFLRDRRGNMVMAPVDSSELRSLSSAGGGLFYDTTLSDQNMDDMLERPLSGYAAASSDQEFTTDLWREQGPLLVLLCLPFLAFVFRRGVLLGVVAFMIMPQSYVEAGVWDDAWSRRDQQGQAAFANEEYERAAKLFEQSQWQAAALYRAENYAESAAVLDGIDIPQANFNRGNALAKAQEFKAAIKAYERTLEQQPDHEDAQFNLDLLKQMQQQQQQSEDQQQEQQDGDQQQESDQQQDGEGESQEQQDSDQDAEAEQNESQDSEEQDAQEQEGQSDEEREAEQQQMQAQMAEQMTEEEQQQAVEQWLRRIPDDPGGLLRRKFKRQYRERGPAPRRPGEEW